jgi:hypothetical protein
MTFKEVLAQVIEWLQENKPISYRALKRQFDLVCQLYAALILWLLGFPGKALQRMDEARTLAQELSHPFSLGVVSLAAWLHQYCREGQAAQGRGEATMALSTEQGIMLWLAQGTIMRGWALAMQGHPEEGIAQIHNGLLPGGRRVDATQNVL